MKIINLLLLTIISFSLSAQSLDEELGFIYVKADYLVETNRFDEAIQEFTKIIAKDPSFRDAMYKRAYSKFQVGAFKGTKNDLLDFFETNGITPEALTLFGKTQKNLGQSKAATQTLATANMINGNSRSTRSSGGSSPSKTPSGNNRDKTNSDVIKDEVKKIEDKLSTILDDLLPNKNEEGEGRTTESRTNRTPTQRGDTGRDTNGNTGRSTGRNTGTSGSTTNTDRKEQRSNTERTPEEPKEDTSVKEVFIDEDVTLEIRNGLGARKILEQPSILILSETSGSVVVDLCVNANGKVINAEFNKASSTLATQSIISLAVRKTKEFWFKRSQEQEMCGSIVYKITGS